jgi:hypothetical protein
MEEAMTFWHLEPVLEEIQGISKDSQYFTGLNRIAEEHLGLSLGDLETIGVPRLSLFLLGNQEMDVTKALIAYGIFEKLLEFEDNMFCAAMYRRKVKDLYAVLVDVAYRYNLSLDNYLAS